MRLLKDNPTRNNATPLAHNILKLMEKSGVSDSHLARSLGLPYNTIKRITSGETTDPKISTLLLIANFFNAGIDSLLGEDAHQDGLGPRKPNMVPILSWQDLEKPDAVKEINANNWSNWQPVALPNEHELDAHSFALESRKSMQPRFPTGTVFIIDPSEEPADGDMVLIKILETKEFTLRELAIDPPIWQLLAINDNLSAIEYNQNKYTIAGVVVFTMLHSR